MARMSAIGEVVKRFREERGLTQEVLSGLASVNRSHLSKIELGLRIPTLVILFKLADAMDIQPSEILNAIAKELAESEK